MSARSTAFPLLFAVLASTPALTTAQTSVPIQPPHDSVVSRVISLLQTGDAAQRGSFLTQALTPGARTADSARIDLLLARLHEQGAPYSVLERGQFGRHATVRMASPGAGRVLTLSLSSDRADPARLGAVEVLSTHAAVLDSIRWSREPAATSGQLAAAIRDNLDRMSRGGAFSGTVYVARGDTVLIHEGFGLANRDDSIPNSRRTRYALASMGKMFTATAILQLVGAGKLRLDDTLGKVLPRYPNAERSRMITIRHLLEHSAGLGDQWSTPRRPVPGLAGELARAGAVAHAPLLFEPGSRWSYSNEGYTVLGAVIEELSGLSYHEYVQRHIFAPAGMNETVLNSGVDEIVPHRAVGYRPRADDPLGVKGPRANWSFLGAGGATGAGGGYSTAGDLARFGRALRDGVLLSRSLADSMWTARWPVPGHEGESYGFGSFVADVDGQRVAGHGGGGTGSGIDTGFRHFTDGSYTVVVLTNIDPPVATNLTRALVRFVAGGSATVSRTQ